MKITHSPKHRVFFHTIVFLLTLFCTNVIFAQSESLTKSSTNNLHSLKMAVLKSKLTADDAATLDFFGFSVSLSGNRALIGIRGKRAAYVFELTNGIWTQTAKLVATDVAFNFGVSVSLSGDRALIGANQSASFAGAAYIFDFANGNWTQTAKLTANDAASGDQFGVSVNLSVDNRALIGAPFDDDNSFIDAGSAYVFELSAGNWSQIAKLTASDQAANDEFGISVSLSGASVNLFIARALIGAANNESAYIFESTGGNWLETNILKANMGSVGDQFGRSVSLYADRALVGAYTNQDNGINAGKAYVFNYSIKVWTQTAQLEPDVIMPGSLFGFSVSLSATQALIGAYGNSTAYLFDFANFNWTQASILTTNDGNASDFFGFSVSLSNNVSLVGAYGDNLQGNFTGAAYIFGGNPFYSIGGTVSGLATGNTIELDNNNLDAIVVGNGVFVFNSNLADLAPYNVTVKTAPTSPNQTCGITGGSNGDGTGAINAANVTDISVVCTVDQYNLGVAVNGLAAGNTIELTSNGQSLTFNTDGSANFTTTIDDGSDYAVVLTSQPTSPSQSCNITGGRNGNGSGTFAGSDVLATIICTILELTIDNRLLDFGTVIIGTSNNLTVTLSNNGSGTIMITEFTPLSAPFSITGGNCTGFPISLLSNQSCQIIVEFNALNLGNFNATFDIVSTVSSSPDTISLLGSVQAAQINIIPTLNVFSLFFIIIMVLIMAMFHSKHLKTFQLD